MRQSRSPTAGRDREGWGLPAFLSLFCPRTAVTSVSVPSAGSLITMHMLVRLKEMWCPSCQSLPACRAVW